jgi:hypothetical protein
MIKREDMSAVLFIIDFVMIVIWAICFFFNAGPAIHLILIFSMASALIKSVPKIRTTVNDIEAERYQNWYKSIK